MFNKSYGTIVAGLSSMIIASILFYFDSQSIIGFVLIGIGFVLIGVGILMGFAKMVMDDKDSG